MRTSVNQQPAAGSDYPFTKPDTLGPAVLDVYVSGKDLPLPMFLGLKINNLASYSIDMRLKDSYSSTVLTCTPTRHVDWGSNRIIFEYITTTKVFRIVLDRAGAAALTTGVWYDSSAALDARTVNLLPKRVTSLNVGGNKFDLDFDLVAGNNIQAELAKQTRTDGGRYRRVISIDGVPGAGEGQASGCDTANPFICSINGIKPTAEGTFTLDLESCYWLQRPVQTDYGIHPTTATFASTADKSKLKINNDCGPCNACSYYVNVYRGLKEVWKTWQTIADSAIASNQWYQQNILRWNDAAACRQLNSINTVMLQEAEGRLFLGASYCNFSNACIVGAQVRVTMLRYKNGVLQTPAPSGVAMNEAYMQTGPTPEKKIVMDGGWPVWTTKIDRIQPSDTVSLRMRLCTTGGVDETYRLALSIHFDNTSILGTATIPVATAPTEFSDKWVGLDAVVLRAYSDKAVAMNPNKNPFDCTCST